MRMLFTGALPLIAIGWCRTDALAADSAVGSHSMQSFAQLTVEQTLIVRVPRRSQPKPLKWKTKKGPKCVPMAAIAGAAVVADDAIDLALKGGQRLRAQFSSRCPALDYYSGFYILPTEDGQICADRDVIRTRSGGQCEIQRFRRLVPND